MHDSTVRKRKFRRKRRQEGMKAMEVWLPPETAALVEQIKQPEESLSQLIDRALRALQAQAAHGGQGVTSLVTSNVLSLGPQKPAEPLSYEQHKAALLARMQEMEAQGLSHAAIARQLNAEQVPTLSRRGTWQAGTVGKLLAQTKAPSP